MKNKLQKFGKYMALKKALFLGLVFAGISAMAQESQTNNVKSLWEALGLDFKDFFEKTFDALSTPVGIVLAVIFVMCIFYLCVRLATRSISPSRRV